MPKHNNTEPFNILREEVKATLTRAMLAKKVSGEKLADLTGLAPGTVRMLRGGKVGGTFFNLAILLTALDESMDQLISRVMKRCHDEGIQWPITL